MRTNIHILLLSLVLVATSCDKNRADSGMLVPVSASVCMQNNSGKAVKSPYLENTPSESAPLPAYIFVSTSQGQYPDENKNGKEGDIAIHTTVTFRGTSNQTLEGVFYSESNMDQNIYISALHPQQNWNIDNTFKATYGFDGHQDVMYAPETFANYNREITPELNFKHLLTHIKIYMYAENTEVVNAWGKISSIKIYPKTGKGSSKVEVDLNNKNISFIESTDSYKTYLYTKNSDNKFPTNDGYKLATSKTEVAYTMIAPLIATVSGDEYVIDIASSSGRSLTVPVNLINVNSSEGTSSDFTGNTMGKQFDLTLKFTKGLVTVLASAEEWETGGTGVGKFEE